MKIYLLIVCFLFLSTHIFSQEIKTDPYENRVIQKRYTKADLSVAESQDYEKFKWIKYYYIHSFVIDKTETDGCPLFIPELFDVTDYESFRLSDRRVTVTEPIYGIKITLLSQRELDLLDRKS